MSRRPKTITKADLSIFKKHANCDPEERTGRRTAQLAISRMQSRGLEELRTWQAEPKNNFVIFNFFRF
jgi:hypothetical protein